jgi:hypothetical protein
MLNVDEAVSIHVEGDRDRDFGLVWPWNRSLDHRESDDIYLLLDRRRSALRSKCVLHWTTRLPRQRGRKRIVAPDGSEIVPTSKPQRDVTLAKALVRAWRWQRMLDEGVYTSVSEIGDNENISKKTRTAPVCASWCSTSCTPIVDARAPMSPC